MKEGWTYRKLGEVCNIDYGTRVVRSRDAGTLYPVYGGGGATFRMDTYNRENCMVISRFGMSEQCTRFVKEKFFLNDSGLTLSVKDGSVVQEFMDWQILSLNDTIYSLGRGAAQKNLDTKALAEIPVVFPNNLDLQQHIVARLDAAFANIDALRDNAERQFSEARVLFQSALAESMRPEDGWELKTVGEVFKTYAGGTPTKSNKDYYTGGTIPWIRSGEVCRKYITQSEMYITEKGMKSSSAKYYPVDTILVAMYGATAAQVGILKFEATSNQAVCGILPHEDYVPEYVYYWFSMIQRSLAAQAQGGAQPNISQEKIKRVQIPRIPLSAQHAIVERLDAVSERVRQLEEVQRRTLQECDALKQALLKEVFG